ncbi:hypothetical protein M8818_006670 [Zalaria obscura]|uniref:Uncharacterized protein n=1 Tax=Zalaria obscura TaxID=2024903 RepID=A0ACC3S907_9PEZI
MRSPIYAALLCVCMFLFAAYASAELQIEARQASSSTASTTSGSSTASGSSSSTGPTGSGYPPGVGSGSSGSGDTGGDQSQTNAASAFGEVDEDAGLQERGWDPVMLNTKRNTLWLHESGKRVKCLQRMQQPV